MRLYRLSTAPYADRLDGEGAAIRGARWNPRKTPMLYTAAEPALAVLEVLAHFNAQHEVPDNTVLVTYELSGRGEIRRPAPRTLPTGWDVQGPPYNAAAQAYGAAFIASAAVLLRVPSVVVRNQWNYLLNPRTLHGRVRIVSIEPFTFDPRLLRALPTP
jgi:RES domain-containing protein